MPIHSGTLMVASLPANACCLWASVFQAEGVPTVESLESTFELAILRASFRL